MPHASCKCRINNLGSTSAISMRLPTTSHITNPVSCSNTSIGDTIWYDLDGDGEIDFEEEPLPGVTVSLIWSGFDGVMDTADDVQFPSQVSGENGDYLFSGVPPGPSRMAVSDADEELEPTTAESMLISLGAGEAFLDADVGYLGDDELPYTGLDVQRLLGAAAWLILAGLFLLAAERRRQPGLS